MPAGESTSFDDEHPWRAAIVFGLFAIALGMCIPIVVPLLHGQAGWWLPGDAWRSLHAAHYVSQGAYPLIYEPGPMRDAFDAGPLLPLVLAPVALLGDIFRLQEGYPFPRPYPDMWLVLGPYALASAFPLMYAVRALATQLGVRAGRARLQGVVLVVAFVPMAVVYGHYEDVIALALLMLAFRDLFAGREVRGAIFLAVAIAFKQWSLLAVPVYVAGCPAPLRVRVAVRSVVPPALFMGAFLALDYRYASAALLHPPAFPLFGHAAVWVAPHATFIANAPQRAGAFVVALAAAWLVRDRRDPAVVLSALGLVLLARFLFEPTVFSYYLVPGLGVLLVAAWSARRRIVTNVTLSVALLLMFPFHPSRWLWWIAVYGLTAAVAYKPVTEMLNGRAPRSEEFAPIRPLSAVQLARMSHR